ncbi:MAG TPA: hypothetical protein EYP60_03085 [bacterium (Candidatus Stahlbacteria)]|nr:hypothetical protein [Candidatus Stahlbacteria bacterium]
MSNFKAYRNHNKCISENKRRC